MLLKDFLNEGVARLEPLYPTKEARNIMLMLCESRIGTKSYTHIVEPGYQIKDKSLDGLNSDLDRLALGEPVQYVIGFADFCGLRFKVTPDVLIPRPETELLCREAIKVGSRIQRMRKAYGKSARPVRILDLCTGSGCIAWTVALSIPGAEVVGVDISEKAVAVASGQDFASALKESDAVAPRFVVADVLAEHQPFAEGEFDLVLSNPPYIMSRRRSGCVRMSSTMSRQRLCSSRTGIRWSSTVPSPLFPANVFPLRERDLRRSTSFWGQKRRRFSPTPVSPKQRS